MWPKEIRARLVYLVEGGVAYHLDHDQVGELGRILLLPAGPKGCQVICEVLSLADGGFDERKRILVPLEQMVTEALARTGKARSSSK